MSLCRITIEAFEARASGPTPRGAPHLLFAPLKTRGKKGRERKIRKREKRKKGKKEKKQKMKKAKRRKKKKKEKE